MKFDELLKILGDEPVFSSSLLLAGARDGNDIRRQLSRWVKGGKLIQLRRSLYMPAELYRKTSAHPFLLANRMKTPSYVSLQSALAHYGLIPEYVPVITSVTSARPEKLDTPCGTFAFKHVKKSWFTGYVSMMLPDRRSAFIASPEKALLDLIYLTPGADNPEYLRALRLQNTDQLDMKQLRAAAASGGSAKLIRAAEAVGGLRQEEGYTEL